MYLNPGKTKNKVLKTIMIYFIKLNSVNIEPENYSKTIFQI